MSNVSQNIQKVKGSVRETFKITTTRPVAILMIVIGVFVFGWQSLGRLPLNLMPDITYPSLTIRTEAPGASPEWIEQNVSRRIEDELSKIDNLVNISSISKSGLSDVILEFKWNTDMNQATSDVRENLDRVFLPEDETEKPIILRYDPSLDPIIRLALYTTKPEPGLSGEEIATKIRDYADNELRQKLETVEGVAAVRVRGGLESELLISLQEDKIRAKGIDPEQVIARVRAGNINVAGGNLREGETEYQVRVLNEYQDLETIENLIIDRRGGVEIRLSEIANVTWSHKDREIYTRVDGKPSVELQIFKEADANIVAVAQSVRERVYGTPQEQALAQRLKAASVEQPAQAEGEEQSAQRGRGRRGRGPSEPAFLNFEVGKRNWEFSTLTDQSIFIKNSIDEVMSNAVVGGILAIIVLFLFLRSVKSTILIGLTIPVSVIATFAPMMMFGVSLNIMSLGGLALGIGMLVDSSIVVLESIFRCKEEGDSLIQSVIRGTSEVGGAVIASTLTTIAVFFPIVFVEGVAGQIFGDMALTVVFSLLASLLCALFFIPMLASRQAPDISETASGGNWKFVAAGKVKRQVEEKWNRAKGLGGKITSLIYLVPMAIFWSIISIPGTLYDLFFRDGESISNFTRRMTSYWSDGSSILKILWAIPHYLLSILAFPLDVLLDFLGRPYSSMSITKERLARFWQKERGLLGRIWMIIAVIPVHLYNLVIFAIHFLLEIIGRALKILLVLFASALRLFVLVVGGVLGLILYPVLWLFGKLIDAINEAYPSMIKWSLDNKIALLLIVVVLVVPAVTFVYNLKAELIPEIHQGEFNIRIKAPVGTDIEQTNRIILGIEEIVQDTLTTEHADGSTTRIHEKIATTVGSEKSSSTRSDEGENTAVITVRLKQEGDIKAAELEAIDKVRQRIRQIPGIEEPAFDRPVLFSFKTPIEVEIKGSERQMLKIYSEQAAVVMDEIPGVTDVVNSIQPGSPELQIVFDREKLRLYGMDIRTVAEKIRNLVEGFVATDFRKDDIQYDVRVRMRRVDITNKADLENLTIGRTAQGAPIRVSDVGYILTQEGPNEIRRIDQERTAVISANTKDVDLKTATDAIERRLAEISQNWQADYRYEITGQTEEMKVSSESMQWAMALAIFLVYIVMASQFESLMQPFIIIFSIPLALLGVIYMLYFSSTPVSVVVLIGVIMLVGIVVNNAIVLVDYINQLRERGLKKIEAIVEAGKARLRPILMTTMTTVLGLLPLALGLGAGTEIRAPMAWTVIAGLISSTFLTLLVIPTIYAIIDRRSFSQDID